MTRILNGFHVWNQGYEEGWTDALATSGPAGGCVLLDMLVPHWYPELRKQMGPEFLIGIRLYSEAGNDHWQGRHWNECNPTGWAEECARRLGSVPGLLDDPFVCAVGANEQDLASEGHPEAATSGQNNVPLDVYREIWTWQYIWLSTMRRILPNAKIAYGTTPLAGGHEPAGSQPDSEYGMPEFKALEEIADCLWDHGYANPDGSGSTADNGGYWHALRSLRPKGYDNPNDPGGLATQYPHKLLIRGEFGNFRHYDVGAVGQTMRQFHDSYQVMSESGRHALVVPFIWNSGNEHWPNRIQPNGGLVQALKAMYRYPAADWPLQTRQEIQPMDAETQAKIAQLLQQNHDITEALVALREGRFTGPGSVDGYIAALRGGQLPDGYKPVFPKG